MNLLKNNFKFNAFNMFKSNLLNKKFTFQHLFTPLNNMQLNSNISQLPNMFNRLVETNTIDNLKEEAEVSKNDDKIKVTQELANKTTKRAKRKRAKRKTGNKISLRWK